ncbi:hypothetical protein H9P43_007265 [Blastocladiella emersonii ATCC 22665]|nr:hypothetical protein H9P43_007265 [Blastocladiella emersonii ATCC 22665]
MPGADWGPLSLASEELMNFYEPSAAGPKLLRLIDFLGLCAGILLSADAFEVIRDPKYGFDYFGVLACLRDEGLISNIVANMRQFKLVSTYPEICKMLDLLLGKPWLEPLDREIGDCPLLVRLCGFNEPDVLRYAIQQLPDAGNLIASRAEYFQSMISNGGIVVGRLAFTKPMVSELDALGLLSDHAWGELLNQAVGDDDVQELVPEFFLAQLQGRLPNALQWAFSDCINGKPYSLNSLLLNSIPDSALDGVKSARWIARAVFLMRLPPNDYQTSEACTYIKEICRAAPNTVALREYKDAAIELLHTEC